MSTKFSTSREDAVLDLLKYGGSWGTQLMADTAKLDGFPPDYFNPSFLAKVATVSSGFAARKNMELLSKRTHTSFWTIQEELKPNLLLPQYQHHLSSTTDDRFTNATYWLRKLAVELETQGGLRKLGDHLFKTYRVPSFVKEFFQKHTGPWLCELHGWSPDQIRKVRFVRGNITQIKKWGLIKNDPVIYLEEEDSRGRFHSKVLYRCIHDATHALHLSMLPTEPEREFPLYCDPAFQLNMEIIAIYSEWALLQQLESGKIPEWELSPLIWTKIHHALLLNMFERVTRLEFDVATHHLGRDLKEVMLQIHTDYGLDLNVYGAGKKHHGLPGSALSDMLGLSEFLNEKTKQERDKYYTGEKLVWGGLPEFLREPIKAA